MQRAGGCDPKHQPKSTGYQAGREWYHHVMPSHLLETMEKGQALLGGHGLGGQALLRGHGIIPSTVISGFCILQEWAHAAATRREPHAAGEMQGVVGSPVMLLSWIGPWNSQHPPTPNPPPWLCCLVALPQRGRRQSLRVHFRGCIWRLRFIKHRRP